MTEQYLDTMTLAGRIIIENGGETYRVEDTVTRMGYALGFAQVEVFAIPSGIFIGVCTTDQEHESRILRTRERSTDLRRIDEVNSISRGLAAKRITPDEALTALETIADSKPLIHPVGLVLGAGLCGMGFTWMFHGGLAECLVSFVVACLAQVIESLLQHFRMESLLTTLIRSFVTAFPALLFFGYVMPGNVDATIGGALMPLLPGLVMTGGVQDILRGDMVSGASRLLRALLIAALAAFGALIASSLHVMIGGLL